jgi:hypothetical protein
VNDAEVGVEPAATPGVTAATAASAAAIGKQSLRPLTVRQDAGRPAFLPDGGLDNGIFI